MPEIQFDPNLAFQKQAIDAITGVFEGQEICRTNFTVAPLQFATEPALPGMEEKGLGIGNRLYGFTKFIIVVPSIAIKEGVHKLLQITADHFRELYENVNFDYFVYDSGKLSDVRNFATSPDIQIMVINIDAFRKSFSGPEKENKANIIHRSHDRMTGAKPIGYIQETHPIVIIDEPQSVDTTARSKQAIASLNPLCNLRYSATHVDQYHMLYKLDSVDAYEQKLVKQIEVAGVDVVDGYNKAYIKLISVDNYRWYDADGNRQKGKFAAMFEQAYARAIKKPKYQTLFDVADLDTLPAEVHNGYFAVDKKKDTSGKEMIKDASGKTLADERAYNLIMKDKEKLLSFDSRLKFIFSHSALKEGWNNPNVFQICNLREMGSEKERRQTIGPGPVFAAAAGPHLGFRAAARGQTLGSVPVKPEEIP